MSNSSEKSKLVTENIGLVHACANRFKSSGVEYDDLFQAGCVGLIKAAAGFNKELGFKFSTYAVPAILGEIKRIFRDGTAVKIGRNAKEKAKNLLAVRDELAKETGKEPTICEISKRANMDPAEASALIGALLPVVSLTAGDDDNQTDIPVPAIDEKLTERLDLTKALKQLDENERTIIKLRYFDGLTQSAVAEIIGISQVQVSRKEKAILIKLRKILS